MAASEISPRQPYIRDTGGGGEEYGKWRKDRRDFAAEEWGKEGTSLSTDHTYLDT